MDRQSEIPKVWEIILKTMKDTWDSHRNSDLAEDEDDLIAA